MWNKCVAFVAAGLLALGMGTGVASASSLPSGSTAGSSAITGSMGMNAPAGTVINQGDPIYMLSGRCTVGYVDRAAGIIHTAAHCGVAGEPVMNRRNQVIGFYEQSNTVGHVVEVPLRNLGILLGLSPLTFVSSSKSGIADIARIRLVPGVKAGANKFSGDAIVPLHSIRPGERYCAMGSRTKRVSCGHIFAVNGFNVSGTMRGLRKGDSGGPSWIPGRGYVGSLSGKANFSGEQRGLFEQFVHASAR